MKPPHPIAIGLALLLTLVGIQVNHSISQLAGAWFICLIALILLGFGFTHMKFVMAVIFPLYLALLLVWVVIVDGPPPVPHVTGFQYANRISLQILLVGATFQLVFLPLLKQGQLIHTLRAWGLRGSFLTVIASAIILLEDLNRRARLVAEARIARGLAFENVLGRIRHISATIAPLFVSMVDSSLKRAELWEHRNLQQETIRYSDVNIHYSALSSLVVLIIPLCWIMITVRN